MTSQMNLNELSTSPTQGLLSKLEKRVEDQSKTIQRLSDVIYRTNNVLIDMVQGMFCHQTQQNILHKHLSYICVY